MNPDEAFVERWRCLNVGSATKKEELFGIKTTENDIFIVTHPKSGTSWISQIVQQIRTRGQLLVEGNFMNEAIPPFSAHGIISGFHPGKVQQRGQPNCFFTHYYVSQLPEPHGKVIYLARRPEDVILSYYKFASDYAGLGTTPPSPEAYYFNWYRNPAEHRMTVWQHIIDARRCMEKDDRIMWLHYEDLQKDMEACIRAVADWLGVKLTEEELALVKEHSSYKFMLDHPDETDGVFQLQRSLWANLNRPDVSEMVLGRVREGTSGRGSFELPESITDDMRKMWKEHVQPALKFDSYDDMLKQWSILK